MTKIVYNSCFGGFSLSAKALARYNEIKGTAVPFFEGSDIDRTDPALVQVVEELGRDADGPFAELAIAELAAGTLYRIEKDGGRESVETVDSIDWKVA